MFLDNLQMLVFQLFIFSFLGLKFRFQINNLLLCALLRGYVNFY
uniref:Uncharacterized protein n=1 Tax=Arundo donax TaxID=35708 RepID=A0A0A9HM83_ARUDO